MSISAENILEFIIHNEFEFTSTHKKLSVPIINRIYKKMLLGIKFNSIRVHGNQIIDGHHRYIGSKLANISVESISNPRSTNIITYQWLNVKFVEEEWDTPNKILYLNELDATYNNIDLKKLIEYTK